MARSLSLMRRRANLVDLGLQARAGVAAYQFSWATNFDAAPTALDTVPAAGKRSGTVQEVSYVDGNYRNITRFLFNPADYSISDTKPFWLTIKQVTTAGVVGPAEALHLILPYSSTPNRGFSIAGGAPAGATIANSLELQLPMQCHNLFIQDDGSADLFFAFEPGGAEQRIAALTTSFTDFVTCHETFYQLFVRGSGGTTTFSATMALRNNPIT